MKTKLTHECTSCGAPTYHLPEEIPNICDNCGAALNLHEQTKETSYDPKSRYYDAGGIETLDYIRAKLTPEQYKGYLMGNLLKYISRANFKDSFSRDIEKATRYAKWLNELQERNHHED